MSEALYFIAILPPENIQQEITELKHLVKERFGSAHALNAPPHITLHMPFKWKDKRIDQLTNAIREINEQVEPFEVELKNFDAFEPRVVFVDVVESELLRKFQMEVVAICRRELKLDNADYKNRGFHPHVTIAFRDLKKPQFYQAKEFFEGLVLNHKFQLEGVELLKHDGKNWRIFSG